MAAVGKSRSYTACLSEAHRMLFDNIRLIFGRTWVYAAVASLVAAAQVSLTAAALLHGGSTAAYAGIGAVAVMSLCALTAFAAKVMSLVNGRRMVWNAVRCGRLALCGVCLSVIIGVAYAVAAYAFGMTVRPTIVADLQPLAAALGCATLVITLLALPFVYVALKYLMEPKCKLRQILFRSYAVGLRHWGLMFVALLLAALCTTVCGALVSVPTLIVGVADALSVYGVNYLGDPSGLPSYFGAVRFGVFALSAFVGLYINVFTIFVCYFLYGSIETREHEKREFGVAGNGAALA